VSTRRNEGRQRTLPTRLRTHVGSARQRSAQHAFSSYSLARQSGLLEGLIVELLA
jgi:hypothetical protein